MFKVFSKSMILSNLKEHDFKRLTYGWIKCRVYNDLKQVFK